MGLWMGASALTIIELVDLVFRLCHRGCCQKGKSKKKIPGDSTPPDSGEAHNPPPGYLHNPYLKDYAMDNNVSGTPPQHRLPRLYAWSVWWKSTTSVWRRPSTDCQGFMRDPCGGSQQPQCGAAPAQIVEALRVILVVKVNNLSVTPPQHRLSRLYAWSLWGKSTTSVWRRPSTDCRGFTRDPCGGSQQPHCDAALAQTVKALCVILVGGVNNLSVTPPQHRLSRLYAWSLWGKSTTSVWRRPSTDCRGFTRDPCGWSQQPHCDAALAQTVKALCVILVGEVNNLSVTPPQHRLSRLYAWSLWGKSTTSVWRSPSTDFQGFTRDPSGGSQQPHCDAALAQTVKALCVILVGEVNNLSVTPPQHRLSRLYAWSLWQKSSTSVWRRPSTDFQGFTRDPCGGSQQPQCDAAPAQTVKALRVILVAEVNNLSVTPPQHGLSRLYAWSLWWNLGSALSQSID